MVDFDRAQQLMERGILEIAPLAFMRGRTLNDSFVILDEAQNTTGEQMKMFLTRLGFESKAVVTGDVTQIDLPDRRRSGLTEAETLLKDVEGISICHFTEVDVVRHPLVAKIILAYERKRADDDADQLVVTADMRERKGRMDAAADAFIALPGGLGTLEELLEVWVSRTLAMHRKPVVVLDPTGVLTGLADLVDKLVAQGPAALGLVIAVAVACPCMVG